MFSFTSFSSKKLQRRNFAEKNKIILKCYKYLVYLSKKSLRKQINKKETVLITKLMKERCRVYALVKRTINSLEKNIHRNISEYSLFS